MHTHVLANDHSNARRRQPRGYYTAKGFQQYSWADQGSREIRSVMKINPGPSAAVARIEARAFSSYRWQSWNRAVSWLSGAANALFAVFARFSPRSTLFGRG